TPSAMRLFQVFSWCATPVIVICHFRLSQTLTDSFVLCQESGRKKPSPGRQERAFDCKLKPKTNGLRAAHCCRPSFRAEGRSLRAWAFPCRFSRLRTGHPEKRATGGQ